MAGMSGKDAKTPLTVPLHAGLADLPPILIQAGTAESFFG